MVSKYLPEPCYNKAATVNVSRHRISRTEAWVKELLLLLALLLTVAWLVVRLRRGRKELEEASAVKSPAETSVFHAVSLKYSSSACDAAKAMTGRRFLASAAPRLPLPECDALECRCGFAHHSDRRSGNERRNPFNKGMYTGGTGKMPAERRDRKDRRRHSEISNF